MLRKLTRPGGRLLIFKISGKAIVARIILGFGRHGQGGRVGGLKCAKAGEMGREE
jgi:hypothetical protein